MRKLLVFSLLLTCLSAIGQTATFDRVRVRQGVTIRDEKADSIVRSVSATSNHVSIPSAKAVYDYVQSSASTVSTTARLSGNGSSGSPLDIAQQSAITGQILQWSGTAWVPSFGTAYTYVVASSTVTNTVNTVLIGTLSANITLGLPTCDAGMDSKSFHFQRTGEDDFSFTIDPSGSQTFNDDHLTKTVFSSPAQLQCTCRFASGTGKWFFNF